jgi:tetratricopeptide (TPR) repeat protein
MTEDALRATLTSAELLMQLGKFAEARTLLKRQYKTNPSHVETMLQLAIAERLLQQWPEAITLLKKATALAPDNMLVVEQLASVLMFSNQGQNTLLAIDYFAQLLAAWPGNNAIGSNLITLALRNDKPRAALDTIVPLLALTLPDHVRLHYAAACAIAAYLLQDTDACARYADMAISVRSAAHDASGAPVRGDVYFMLIYAEFLRDLLAFRVANPALYVAHGSEKMLHVIGESHSLTPTQLVLRHEGGARRVVPHLIMGAKAYFFTPDGPNTWKYALEEIIRRIPKDEPIAVGFGELDCRAGEGIMEQYRRDTDYVMVRDIAALCEAYVKFVKITQLRRLGRTFIIGVPAPNRIAAADLQAGEEAVFTGIHRPLCRDGGCGWLGKNGSAYR